MSKAIAASNHVEQDMAKLLSPVLRSYIGRNNQRSMHHAAAPAPAECP